MPETLRCSRLFCLFLAAVAIPVGAKPLLIRDVQVAPAFFNPSLQQVATLSFTLASAGEASVVVVDRDGLPIRALLSRTQFAAGRHAIARNCQTDACDIVADASSA